MSALALLAVAWVALCCICAPIFGWMLHRAHRIEREPVQKRPDAERIDCLSDWDRDDEIDQLNAIDALPSPAFYPRRERVTRWPKWSNR